jgi:hypothetical protein
MTASKGFSGKHVTLFSLLVFLAFLIYRIVLIFFPHPDAGGVENNVIWFIQRMLDGGSLYTDPERSPYSISQYSPFYYYLNTGIARLLGFDADDVLSLFRLSRLISLIFNVGFAVTALTTVKRIFDSRNGPAIVAGVFSFIFLEITSFSRPDSLQQLSFLLYFYCFALNLKKDNSSKNASISFLLSAVFAALAFFAKQSAVIIIIIMMIWFLRHRQVKLLFYWFGTYLLVMMLGLVIIQMESGLQPFYQNTVAGINNGVSLYWFWDVIIKGFYQQFGLLWVPALIIVIQVIRKDKRSHWEFMSLAMIVVFVFSNFIALKWGSSPGYFTEWYTLVFIGVSGCYNKTIVGMNIEFRKPVLISVIFILLIKVTTIIYPVWDMVRPGIRLQAINKYQQEVQVADTIKSKLGAESAGVVFNNSYSPDTYLNNLLFREVVMPQFEVVIFGTWKNHVFDYGGFKKDMEDGTVRYILGKSANPLQFMELTFNHFQLKDSIEGYSIFEYNR